MLSVESIPGVMETGYIPSIRSTRNNKVSEESTDSDVLKKHLKKVLQFVSEIFFHKVYCLL